MVEGLWRYAAEPKDVSSTPEPQRCCSDGGEKREHKCVRDVLERCPRMRVRFLAAAAAFLVEVKNKKRLCVRVFCAR